MAAIRTIPLHLWTPNPSGGASLGLGSLLVTGIDGPFSRADGGLRIGIEYRPPTASDTARRLVSIDAKIASALPERRVHGRVRPLVDPLGQSAILGRDASSHWWLWALTQSDIEAIEQERAPNAGSETLSFNLEVGGVAVVGSETVGLAGEVQLSLATSDWLGLLGALGYITPPAIERLNGQAMTLAPPWAKAEGKLLAARRHLALGEDREALASAYRVFDAIATNPYKAKWGEALDDPDMPGEKADVIRELLRAHAQALSKLGRHPSYTLVEGSDRQMLPLDHWEAELLVALSQMLLAAAERWRSICAAHELERPAPPSEPEPS
ncbi:MAG: hypothetical protein ACYDAN_12125 [Candidatus Limnocylindrales bacterium]